MGIAFDGFCKDGVIPFGKFKGKGVGEVPSSYLQFIRKRFRLRDSWSERWVTAAKDELNRRKVPEKDIQFSNWAINTFSKIIGKERMTNPAVRDGLRRVMASFQPDLTSFGEVGGIIDFMEYIFHEAIEYGMINKIPGEKAMYMVIHNQLMWKYIKTAEITGSDKEIYDVLKVVPTPEAVGIMKRKLKEKK